MLTLNSQRLRYLYVAKQTCSNPEYWCHILKAYVQNACHKLDLRTYVCTVATIIIASRVNHFSTRRKSVSRPGISGTIVILCNNCHMYVMIQRSIINHFPTGSRVSVYAHTFGWCFKGILDMPLFTAFDLSMKWTCSDTRYDVVQMIWETWC